MKSSLMIQEYKEIIPSPLYTSKLLMSELYFELSSFISNDFSQDMGPQICPYSRNYGHTFKTNTEMNLGDNF